MLPYRIKKQVYIEHTLTVLKHYLEHNLPDELTERQMLKKSILLVQREFRHILMAVSERIIRYKKGLYNG